MTKAPRLLANPHAGAAPVGAEVETGPVLAFHRSLPRYRPTPLFAAPAIAARLGVAQVWVKDESDRLGMPSFKILGASWATFRALCARVGIDHGHVDGLAGLRAALAGHPLTLVAATDGNHGRAVARMARELGLGAHILVPRDMVAARIAALQAEGARVTIVPGTYDEAVAASARLADETHVVVSDTSWPGYEQVPGWVIDGYATIVAEVHDQLAEAGAAPPTVVAAQIGVGAFAAAVVRGFPEAAVVGVEPTKAACVMASLAAGALRQVEGDLDSIMAGLNCGTPSPVAWPDLVAGLRHVVTVDDAAAEEAMRVLAAAGVVSGESGAAGLAGLLTFGARLGLGPNDRVLVVSTEGATDPVAYDRIVAHAHSSS
ncbi:MAG TPA: diaminopropionate ammonia-lyase [Actinomycetes bacterium]|nr:diaminopropionate ammonia-lyase [Actinomycetes bacterium]